MIIHEWVRGGKISISTDRFVSFIFVYFFKKSYSRPLPLLTFWAKGKDRKFRRIFLEWCQCFFEDSKKFITWILMLTWWYAWGRNITVFETDRSIFITCKQPCERCQVFHPNAWLCVNYVIIYILKDDRNERNCLRVCTVFTKLMIFLLLVFNFIHPFPFIISLNINSILDVIVTHSSSCNCSFKKW